jgi:ABC-type multidrug transport system ATPase subunit
VLKDVSFSTQQGEIVGIVGENGVGKTTLLKILIGLLKPNSGSVHTEGRVGYCPQDMLIFERLTVRENFRYFATAYGMLKSGTDSNWEEIKDDLLRRFRFSQYDNMLVSQLSGGTKQKLNLSLALLHSPELIILDEPYAAFDWETYLHFWDYALEMRTQNRSLLIVSHFIYDRSRLDTLYKIEDGIIKCD